MSKNISLNEIPSPEEIRIFRYKILGWFEKHGRKYPWRDSYDPFKILIAEMMLRRTKADQVKPVYEQFFSEFSDVEALANAEDQTIEKILYPLGLKWRTPAFKLLARELKEKYHYRIPDKREELKKLPGVGSYVAGAVLSIGYGKKEWMVDSNIVRVFRRYFGVKTSKEGRRDRQVIEMAKVYVFCRNPRNANLAILDFTALTCIPRKPRCKICPLQKKCKYVSSIP